MNNSLLAVPGEINDGDGNDDFEDNFIFEADKVEPRFSEPMIDNLHDPVGEGISPHEYQEARDIPDLDPLEEEGEDPIMSAGTQTLRPFFFFFCITMFLSQIHFH